MRWMLEIKDLLGIVLNHFMFDSSAGPPLSPSALCGRSLVGSGTEGLMAEGENTTALTHFGVRHPTDDREEGPSPKTCGRQHLKHGKGGKGGPRSAG